VGRGSSFISGLGKEGRRQGSSGPRRTRGRAARRRARSRFSEEKRTGSQRAAGTGSRRKIPARVDDVARVGRTRVKNLGDRSAAEKGTKTPGRKRGFAPARRQCDSKVIELDAVLASWEPLETKGRSPLPEERGTREDHEETLSSTPGASLAADRG